MQFTVDGRAFKLAPVGGRNVVGAGAQTKKQPNLELFGCFNQSILFEHLPRVWPCRCINQQASHEPLPSKVSDVHHTLQLWWALTGILETSSTKRWTSSSPDLAARVCCSDQFYPILEVKTATASQLSRKKHSRTWSAWESDQQPTIRRDAHCMPLSVLVASWADFAIRAVPSPKLTWQWKMKNLKIIWRCLSCWTRGIFHCPVSLPKGIIELLKNMVGPAWATQKSWVLQYTNMLESHAPSAFRENSEIPQQRMINDEVSRGTTASAWAINDCTGGGCGSEFGNTAWDFILAILACQIYLQCQELSTAVCGVALALLGSCSRLLLHLPS